MLTADQAARLIEIVDAYAHDHEPLLPEDAREVAALTAALRDAIVEADAEEEEAGEIEAIVPSEHVGDADAYGHVLAPVVATLKETEAAREWLYDKVQKTAILVEEPVPAGSLPPETLVYRKHEPKP